MTADIVQELNDEARSCINLADGAQNAIVNERENRLAMQFSRAAAEIVRLRGEVEFHQLDAGALRVQLDSCIERLEVQTKNALHLHAMMVDAEARAEQAIAPAEAKDPAPAMPNGVEEMVAYLDNWLSREHGLNLGRVKVGDAVDAALRAAGNRDAAGVTDERGRPMTYWGGTPAAVPAGEAVAWIRDNLPESLHGMGVVDVLQLLLDGGIAAEKDLIDAESPQPADGEAVAEWQVWHEQDGWGATHPDNVAEYRARGVPVRPLYAHPPAPVQAAPQEGEWPDYVMLRDTKLHDDAGGLGQRIFTTAGAGYAKVKYVRADLAPRPSACELGAVRALIERWHGWIGQYDTGDEAIRDCIEELENALRVRPSALQHRGDSRGGEG